MIKNKYALIVESKEAKSSSGTVVTEEGDRFLVKKNPDGWTDATSVQWSYVSDLDCLSDELKVFTTKEAAIAFARKWTGHPWYCKPNGNFEVIEVLPVYKKSLVGHKFVGRK